MIGLLVSLAAGVAAGGAALLLLHAGLRAGDQPGDVTVTVALSAVLQPDGPHPVVVVTVRNPGNSPVLVGMSARAARLPRWLDPGLSVSAPWRTTRPALLPGRQSVAGVAAPGTGERWQVPVPPQGRRYRLTVVAGQAGRRLRVIRAAVPAQITAAAGTRPGIRQPGS